jgi:hypothetical protein
MKNTQIMNNGITIKEMRSIVASPFMQQMSDESAVTSVNGKQMQIAYWNLIVSVRDVSLYSKNIKPHRNWRISDVKNYFGVKGNPTKILGQLQELRDIIKNGQWDKFKVN